jgi:adenylylsulfate reductase subunit A
MDGDRVAGAVGFSTREEKFYVFKAKAAATKQSKSISTKKNIRDSSSQRHLIFFIH